MSARTDAFVVVCIGKEVWVAQAAVMGTAQRPHMQNRAYSHYTPLFRTQARDELNDAYSIAQTLAVWLNLGLVAWSEAKKVPLVPSSQAEPVVNEQPAASEVTDSAPQPCDDCGRVDVPVVTYPQGPGQAYTQHLCSACTRSGGASDA